RTQSTPATFAAPAVGRASPTRILMVVVLPAPLGPTKPRISPRPTDIVSPSRATTLPYLFVRSLVSTTASPGLMRRSPLWLDAWPRGGRRSAAPPPPEALQLDVLDRPLPLPLRGPAPAAPGRRARGAHGHAEVQAALLVQAQQALLGDVEADGVERALRAVQ